jgi:hypothetical protein
MEAEAAEAAVEAVVAEAAVAVSDAMTGNMIAHTAEAEAKIMAAEDVAEVVKIKRTEGVKLEPTASTSAPGTTRINSLMSLVQKDVEEFYNSGQIEMPNAMVVVVEAVQV